VVKASCLEALTDPLVSVRESVTRQCVDALYQYRLTCASSSPPGQLILPESLKLMPLYTLAFLKSDVRTSTLRNPHPCSPPTSLSNPLPSPCPSSAGPAPEPSGGRARARQPGP
jgi:hypothetical protein